MAISYVEDLASSYFYKEGYLVYRNLWFFISKEESGKGGSGWSDIDILAVNKKKLLVVSCVSFLGEKSYEAVSRKIIRWFDYAEKHVREDNRYNHLLDKRSLEKIVVVDAGVKECERLIEDAGIKVMKYDKMFDKLREELKCELKARKGRIGKEDAPIIRFMIALIKNRKI